MRLRPTLYRRLALSLCGPLLLAMVAAWAIGVGLVTRTLEQRVASQSRTAAAALAAWRLPYTPELLRRLASLQQADFVLLDRAGRTAYATDPALANVAPDALAGGRAPAPGTAGTFRIDAPVAALATWQPIEESHDPRYSTLVVVAPLTDAAAAARRAAIWLGVAMLGATALLATVLLVLVRGITRPLGELAALADRIATGERRERPDVQRADEIGALASALDSMTARLADYEERLAARSRRAALGDMSARLAHEIRNPLTGIKLHLQLLAERSTGADATRFALLLAEVERLELMVASTLVLGSQAPLAPEPLDLSALAADVLELMEPTLQHRGIVVEQQLARLPRLRADRARLRQSLLNLIVNAAEALPAGGRVRLTTCADAEERCALLAVEDSGPGLPEGLPDGEMPTSKPFGLGIGLVVCREVAAAHGGALRVERGAALGGARLVLALPWAPDPTVPESP